LLARADIKPQARVGAQSRERYVVNLLMRVGDYAHVGAPHISVIDADIDWTTVISRKSG
jgi:multidrug resistance efflux pump